MCVTVNNKVREREIIGREPPSLEQKKKKIYKDSSQ